MFYILIFIVALIEAALAVYVRRRMISRIPKGKARTAAIAVWVVACILMCGFLIAPFLLSIRTDSAYYMAMKVVFTSLAVTASMLLLVMFDLLSYIPRIFKGKRSKWLTCCGAGLAAALLIVVGWASKANRFNINVNKVDIPVANLPESFGGYKIAQISDLHVGTFEGDTTFVYNLVARINQLNPDLVVFTGDMVNRHAVEFEPFAKLFKFESKDGALAVLGNHDYADYNFRPSQIAEKEADRERIRQLYSTSGMELLEDDCRVINRGNDSIVVIGVGNIGVGRFPVYGSLTKAYSTPADSTIKILLSHDPNHWVEAISDNPDNNIALTLSGHTHAMQIMLGGHTPASFTYKTPAGVYRDTLGRVLNVNIGAGTVGMPMRLGATPEITLLTLRPAQK